ncbi:MAG: T9SS type A sorting domain-containing protein, partial [Bacteroidales bacterium]|nr:T9SS type A sorting domain-containing protein [Bacteroidales bacterium]
MNGSVLPGSTDTLKVRFNSYDLHAGRSYKSSIEITSNDPKNSTMVVPVNLKIASCYTQSIRNETICEGDIVIIKGNPYGKEGTYRIKYNGQYGCDSVVVLKLRILPRDIIKQEYVICKGEWVTVDDSVYTQPGTHRKYFTNQHGCDSIVDIIVRVVERYETKLDANICEGDIYNYGTYSYSKSGLYIHKYASQYGCDSTVMLNLRVIPRNISLGDSTICKGELVAIGDSVFTSPGIHYAYLNNSLGCDSIVNVTINVIEPEEHIHMVDICEGDFYEFGQTALAESGTYFYTYSNKYGCDSTVELLLNVHEINNTILPKISICDGEGVTVGDSVLTTQGYHQILLKNQYGCDSVVEIELDVLYKNLIELPDANICEGEAVSIGDSVFTTSGDYNVHLVNQYGCDSIVKIKVNVSPKSETIHEVHICEGESYEFENEIYDQNGVYPHSYLSSLGCDSLEILNLHVHSTDYTKLPNAQICEGESMNIGDSVFTSAGRHKAILINQYGCDSIIDLELTVKELPGVNLGNDTTITQLDALVINAGMEHETYKWSTGEFFPSITVSSLFGYPVGEHTFYVDVTNEHSCKASDTIVVTIVDALNQESVTLESFVKVYPNPSKGELNISTSWDNSVYNIAIFNSAGDEVFLRELESKKGVYDISHLNDGFYTMQIIKDDI